MARRSISANGCICCSLADGFMAALNAISKRAEVIDHVIVEASGVSDLVKLGYYGSTLNFELEGVIVLADAEQIREKSENKYVGETVVRQLRGADLLVLNKVDLVSRGAAGRGARVAGGDRARRARDRGELRASCRYRCCWACTRTGARATTNIKSMDTSTSTRTCIEHGATRARRRSPGPRSIL